MAQYIYQMHGLFEMHFIAFIGSAILITYQNWKLQIPLLLVVVIHHGLFGYMQYAGYNNVYFTQLDYMDMQTFIIHIILAAAIFFICGLWAYNFMKNSKRQIELAFEMTRLQQEKAQEEKALKEALLVMSNKKNKDLEQFAFVASHDLQEPLRTTTSFVNLLQQQYQGKLDEKADKYLTYIRQSSDRMKVLIKDLLDYSRIGSKNETQLVDCNIMLNEVLADLGTAIQEASAVIKTDPLPVITGYPTEIKQLFQNLIVNAIKFRKKNVSPLIKISVKKLDGFWQFEIEDNGIGIEPQHHERIFVIFQRLHTRNEYQGTGIGLSHCKKIVELHKGNIWVKSTPGEGSIFHFTVGENNNL
jgi:light-regulated signal transduction histidine kinase (bacteriophytochrome)